MAAKKTHADFLQDITAHNHLYPSKAVSLRLGEEYVNLNTPIAFNCAGCGNTFTTLPRYITIKHSGCPKCAILTTSSKNNQSHKFVEKLNTRNTIYPPVNVSVGHQYIGIHKKLQFECYHNHAPWTATPASILQGHGCPECGLLKTQKSHLYTHDEFVGLLTQKNINHPYKQTYLSDNQEYVGFRSKLQFFCNDNHTWHTTPDNILNGKSGCPYCATSKTFSFMAIDWLTSIEQSDNITIMHRGNSQTEYSIPNTRYTADGYCKETNTVYEFHGNYWHGNPKMFFKDDMNDRVGKTYGELYAETSKKEAKIKSLGYNLVTIWEDEYDNKKLLSKLSKTVLAQIKDMDINVVIIPITAQYDKYQYFNQLNKSLDNGIHTIFLFEDELLNADLIMSKLRHYSQASTTQPIHARKCVIKQISNNEKRDLLNINHVQGNDKAQISYGAYYNNTLVSVMTFVTPRVALGQKHKNKEYEDVWELSRFCTDVKFRIPGIAARLLKHFQRNHAWSEIYSFADRRWSVRNMYDKLGFDLAATNPPAYFYVVDGKRKHRWNYRKDVLKNTLPRYNPDLTEHENMANHGFWWVWDCGTLKYSMKNDGLARKYIIKS